MALQIVHDLAGLEPKVASAIDDIVAAIQTWANQVDGVNAAERLTQITTGIAGLPTVPTGVILDFGGATAPTGYLMCDGSVASRTTYVNLFNVIGTAYGVGDGSTTFTLPDYRQRYSMGKAASGTGSTLGSTFGTIDHTHTGPSHTHTITSGGSHSHTGHTGTPSSGVAIAHTTTPVNADTNGDGVVTAISGFASGNVIDDGVQTHPISSDGAHDHGGVTGSGGTGATSSGNVPTLVCNRIIKT